MSNLPVDYDLLSSEKVATFDIDYVQQAKDLLLYQFKDKPNTNGLLEGLLEPTIEFNQVATDIVDKYNLRTATGKQLDNIGKLLNVSRNNDDDDTYRNRVKSRITVNRATGTLPNLIENLNILLDGKRFTVIEIFPATVQVLVLSPQTIIDEQVVNALLPIGVGGVFFANPYQDKDIWELSNTDESGVIPPENENPNSILPDVADINNSNLVIMDVAFVSA